MAIRSYLKQNDYCVITDINYNSSHKTICFTLLIHEDESKEVLLAEKRFMLSFYEELTPIKAINTIDISDLQDGECAILSKTAKLSPEIPESMNGLLAIKNGSNVDYRFIARGERFYLTSEDMPYKKDDNDEMIPFPECQHKGAWDKWFSHKAISAPSNILEQCYKYMKSLKGFETSKDG